MEQQGIFVERITGSVATDCNFPAPSLADYKKCQSKKELEELEVDDGRTFKGSSCFIPTPFLCCVLINAETNNPLEFIPMVIHAREKLDRENATLDEDYERAIDHVEGSAIVYLQFFQFFLWLELFVICQA